MDSTNKESINQVYNAAFGGRTTLNQLVEFLKESLSEFDKSINDIEVIYGPIREGDIPHSLASIDKAKRLLHYKPNYSIKEGLSEAISWYWNTLKKY